MKMDMHLKFLGDQLMYYKTDFTITVAEKF